MPTFDLPFGPCDVTISGNESGLPILLVHGIIVSGTLWDPIVPALSAKYRVIQPTLPLGAHRQPATNRELVRPTGVADSLAVLLDRLNIERAVVVGSDSGGAISQIFASRHPDRVASLILGSCDALDHFPPTLLKPLQPVLAIPGAIDLLALAYRVGWIRRSWLGAGLVLNHPVDDATIKPWFDALCCNKGARKDMATFIRGCRPKLAHEAAEKLRTFPRPVLLAWSAKDRVFPESDARRLASMIPKTTIQWITNSRTFSMIDQPAQLSDAILTFLETADLS